MPPEINSIGSPFIELHSVDSTNNYATALLHAGMAQHGTVVFAHEQTKGKGQRHKQWVTGAGENIALSIIIQPRDLQLTGAFLFSMAMAVSIHRFFSRYAGEAVKIKWPNDIYWRDRKAAGILIENIVQGSEWKFAVAGMGLNINQPDFGALASRAVSLRQITNTSYNTVALAQELCGDVERGYAQLLKEPDKIIRYYEEHLYKKGDTVTLKKGSRVFQTTIKGVAATGQLITTHTMEERFEVGEVEWIL